MNVRTSNWPNLRTLVPVLTGECTPDAKQIGALPECPDQLSRKPIALCTRPARRGRDPVRAGRPRAARGQSTPLAHFPSNTTLWTAPSRQHGRCMRGNARPRLPRLVPCRSRGCIFILSIKYQCRPRDRQGARWKTEESALRRATRRKFFTSASSFARLERALYLLLARTIFKTTSRSPRSAGPGCRRRFDLAVAKESPPVSPKSGVDQEAEYRAQTRLWLRLLACTTLIEGELRRRFREEFDFTMPRFDVLAQLDREP